MTNKTEFRTGFDNRGGKLHILVDGEKVARCEGRTFVPVKKGYTVRETLGGFVVKRGRDVVARV